MNAEALVELVRQRIESRYRRIRFVHEELAKLDAAAKERGGKNNGERFEDFVFSRIDFSVYKKIDGEEFRLLFDKGLADFDEAFYQKAFRMKREQIEKIIARSYIRAGPFFICKNSNPLLPPIMRTLHTALEFAPLLGTADIDGDAGQIRAIAGVLNGTVIRHSDGRETRLFTPGDDSAKTGSAGSALLCGTFHPLNKAYTITLF